MKQPRCVLLDLDGTLVDTAPDLTFAANRTRHEAGLPELAQAALRPMVSRGSRGLMSVAFEHLREGSGEYEQKRQRLLDTYRNNLHRESRLFPGMTTVLNTLADSGIAWGVVTNKPAWLTGPLMDALRIKPDPVCVISGDSAAHPKPDPAPLFMACEQTGHAVADCLFVGDSERDVEAGHAAGMATVAAAYGYIEPGDSAADWGADCVIHRPEDLLRHMKLATEKA